ACLQRHPDVSQAVVILQHPNSENAQLAAYLILEGDLKTVPTAALSAAMRQHLNQSLPAYMVPATYRVLEKLPLTPNGKVDRKALAKVEPAIAKSGTLSQESSTTVAKQTPVAELVANLWTTVLNLDEGTLNAEQNFFELGGHSLLATQAIARVRQTFGIEIPLRELFEKPTLSEFTRAVEAALAEGKQANLEPIAKINRTGTLPLSSAQQRQWVLAQLEPNNPFYVVPVAVRLQGAFNLERFEHSLRALSDRHEILRTTFPTVNGKATVQIHGTLPDATFWIEPIDLASLDSAQQAAQLQAWLGQAVRQSFDLSQLPLWRVQVLRLAEQEHIVVLLLHHIITDGWSLGVLVQELTQLYSKDIQNSEPPKIGGQGGRSGEPLPALPIQYVDYAAWQQQWLQESAQVQQLNYWRQQLAAAPPLFDFPTDYPRPAVQGFAGQTCSFELSLEDTAALRQLSQQQGVTLFMALLTAFKVLLHRYSGLTDLLVGTPIANRQRAELEGMLGLFVNTLVLRTDLSSNPTFEQLLEQVRSVALAAYTHQDVPLETVIEALDIPRSWSQTPLFQVMFVLQEQSLAQSESIATLGNLTWKPVELHSGTAKFDLTLSMQLSDQGLRGTFEYRTDLFKPETIAHLAEHLGILLRSLPTTSQQRLSELPLLSASEQTQLHEWNQTQTAYPRQHCIQELFEQQVIQSPEAIALVEYDRQLTYTELNQRANQLAHYLRSRGVGPDVLVGLWSDRSIETIITLLAILKAGGAYVPFDPTYPEARRTWLLQDTQLSVFVMVKANQPVLTNPSAIQELICLETDALAIAQQSAENLEVVTQPENLAYVLYTSGSTGQPKGVCTPHRGVVRLVKETNYADFGPDQVFLQAAPIGFDASTFEIWGPLLNGGRLVVLPDQTPSLAVLGQAIATHNITTIWLTAGLFHLIVDEPLESLRSLRQLLAGGDVLSASQIRKALAALPNLRIVNGYGPTEGTTFTCCHPMEASAGLDSEAVTPPIGRPIANTQAYVLDEALQPVPIGVAGELYIGGAGLAWGYLNRPDLTAERFIPNPFAGLTPISDATGSVTAQSYLYKTGDRVRYRADGSLEYLGRLDQQVKIRGFRIEPGEVEVAIAKHPSVQDVAVIVAGKTAEQKQLLAYVVKKSSGSEPPINASWRTRWREGGQGGDLRQYLQTALPSYMHPALIIELDCLPLTANGKVDRRALPKPETLLSLPTQAPPRTEIEQQLADLWQQLLPVKTIGIYDNFFELGGDSILAIQIVSRANQLGLSLTPKQIFQQQTIAALATTLENQPKLKVPETVISQGNVPLTPIQQWFFEQNLSEPHHFNQAICLALSEAIDHQALSQAFEAVVNHHDVFRLRFKLTETGWQQSFAESPADQPDQLEISWFNLANVSDLVSTQQTIANRLQASLNLQQGPLIRVAGFCFKPPKSPLASACAPARINGGLPEIQNPLESGGRGASEQPDQLLIVIHHLVVDGLSWRIFLEDLQLAYSQCLQGQEITLPPTTHSFQQWAIALEQLSEKLSQTGIAALNLDCWQRLPQTQSLPLDVQEPEVNATHQAESVTVTLPHELTTALLQEVPSAYNTQINDVLLTALVQTCNAWTGETSLLLDLESHGRHTDELEQLFGQSLDVSRTLGWFTCIYPVQITLPQALSTGEALRATKAQLRQVPNQGLSYGLLRYLLNRQDLAVEAPVSFNYLGQSADQLTTGSQRVETPGLTRSPQDPQRYALEINSWIQAGQLQIAWTYTNQCCHRQTIEQLAANYLEALATLIRHCQQAETPGYTPEDFELVPLEQAQLDAVFKQVNFAKGAIADLYPLSAVQQGMLFHSLYSTNSGVYVIQLTATLQGELDRLAFEQAWQALIQRHPVLRTAFVWDNLEDPVQVVGRQIQCPITEQDWQGQAPEQQEQQFKDWLASDRRRGFNLSQAPLWRLNLIRVAPGTNRLVWTYHHLLLDGWSVPLLFRELLIGYEAIRQGQRPPLAPVRPYYDYIAWLQQQDLATAKRFWQQRLQGMTAPTPLGIDLINVDQVQNQPRSAAPTHAPYQRQTHQFSNALT
ncbi:MAG: amino acid adenylation domain-containing protein, partial [Cyanobacteria bacterium P01_H01_bin.121]